MKVETKRLLIREFSQADLDGLSAVESPSDAERHQAFDLSHPDQLRPAIRAAITHAREEPRRVWDLAVQMKDGGLIGRGGVTLSLVEPREGTMWFVSDPRFWNQGYITEAAMGLFKFCFEDLKLHRVIGESDPANAGSARLMEKLGMRKEAHFVKNACIKGVWKDTAVWALLEDEWRERTGARTA